MWSKKELFKYTTTNLVLLIISLLTVQNMHAAELEYKQEIGLQGGFGYYIGDATQHSFHDIREAYGVQWRYKFDYRWALQVKGQSQRIGFSMPHTKAVNTNQLWSVDAVGEFNFFRFGQAQYDERIKQITPYIFLGVGVSAHEGVREINDSPRAGEWRVSAYIPLGIGLKWRFAKRWGLQVAWQQNVYLADGLENVVPYFNPNKMNGTNILWNDLTSSFTVGIVFEIGKTEEICRTCR